MRKKRFTPLSAVLALNDFMMCDDRDGKLMPKGTFFSGGQKNNEEAKKMKKSISKTIVTIAIVTAFLMPLMGNTALAEDTEKYYFNTHHLTEIWNNPDYAEMVDGDPDDYASTTDNDDVQLLNGNDCSYDPEGTTITTVKIRANAYYSESESKRTLILQPVFDGSDDGDNQEFTTITPGGSWSPWFDITNDRNAPNPWTWADVTNLDCNVIVGPGLSEFMLFCSMVEIEVNYTTS